MPGLTGWWMWVGVMVLMAFRFGFSVPPVNLEFGTFWDSGA